MQYYKENRNIAENRKYSNRAVEYSIKVAIYYNYNKQIMMERSLYNDMPSKSLPMSMHACSI